MPEYVVGRQGDRYVVIRVSDGPAYAVFAVCYAEADAVAVAAALND